jgi:hypothetical protein
LDTVREWGADRLSQAASAWSGLGSRVRETEDALGAWKDQVVADHPLELRIAGQVTDAALAASQTPTAANCDQAKVEAAEANATAARDPSLEHDVTAAQADAAEIAACLPQGMAQTSLRTPEGFEVQGPASPFDKGGWDSLLNNHDLLQRDDAGPGKLSPSSDGVGEADAQPAESTETVPPQATAAGQPATPGSNTAANALKAARATPEEVEAWAAGLQTQDTPARTPNDLYERAQTGTVNYLIKGGGTQVWADGVRAADAHVLEAKYIDNPARSPYIAGSACPPFVREAAQAQADKEFQRYAAVLADPNNPVHEMEVITSDKRAVAFFNGLLKKYQIRGRVVVRPPNV